MKFGRVRAYGARCCTVRDVSIVLVPDDIPCLEMVFNYCSAGCPSCRALVAPFRIKIERGCWVKRGGPAGLLGRSHHFCERPLLLLFPYA